MKRIVAFFCFLIMLMQMQGQNLVPNPSFEAYQNTYPSFCNCGSLSNPWGSPPTDTISLTPPWYSPTSGSPDCFKPCSPVSYYKVPKNLFGFQYPRTGIGYAFLDLKVFDNDYKNFKEYIQVKLKKPLEMNMQYNAEFFVSLIDSTDFSIDRIGMYISDTIVYLTLYDCGVLPYTPQISNPEFNYLTDTANWVKISGVYTAHGGEQYITIGNFYDYDNTHQIPTNVGSG